MRIIFFLVLSGFCVLISCTFDDGDIGSCDPDVELGTLELSTPLQEYIPYEGDERLTFKNSSSEERFVNAEPIFTFNSPFNVEVLCTVQTLFGSVNQTSFYQLTQHVAGFASGEISFTMTFGPQAFYKQRSATDTVFYDLFHLSSFMAKGDTIVEANIVTSYRNNQQFIQNNAEEDLNSFEFVSDTTLLGIDFANLYHTKSDLYDVFFSTYDGIVAFVENGDVYVLK